MKGAEQLVNPTTIVRCLLGTSLVAGVMLLQDAQAAPNLHSASSRVGRSIRPR